MSFIKNMDILTSIAYKGGILMNLIEESFQTKQEQKKKRTTGIILGAIVLVVIAIIAIISYLMYIQSTTLRVVLNGQVNENLKQLFEEQNPDLENLLQEGGTIYLPIKSVASYFDYQSYNGDYSQNQKIQINVMFKQKEKLQTLHLPQIKYIN